MRRLEDDRAAEAIWRRLEADRGAPSLTSSWDWTATWLRHYGDVVRHWFLTADDGIALVTEQAGAGRLRPRTLRLGTAGEPPGSSVFVERNAPLGGPEFGPRLMQALAREAGWERLELDGLLPAAADALLAGRPDAARREEGCPTADLRDDPVAALPASRRRRVRDTLRRFGALSTEWAETADAAHGILDELIELHARRWEDDGAAGAFASPRFTAFHRELIDRLLPTGRAALFRVRRESETIACLYGLIEGERMLFYQSGLRRQEDNRLRAGVAGHVLFMHACRERGLATYDFLAPASRYKRELATGEDRLVWATIERPRVRLRLERQARRVRAAVRRRAAVG